jgi:tetratricopeptide (TPR) repeat protein
MVRSIEQFQQAIALDPRFALAYVGIADSWLSMPAFSYLSSGDAYQPAIAAARRALELDPSLAEAHAALAFALAVHDWNWEESEREFKRSLALDPKVSGTHFRYGMVCLGPLGRTTEAVAELERALELEPLSLITGSNLALTYLYARRNDRALEQARKTCSLEPGFLVGRISLGMAFNANTMYADAIALCDAEPKDAPMRHWFLVISGYAYAKSGQPEKAKNCIREFGELAKSQYAGSYFLAMVHAALGERDLAFATLRRAVAERDFFVPRINVDPFLDSIREDPRFAELASHMGLIDASRGQISARGQP